jgi:hypothetical protein
MSGAPPDSVRVRCTRELDAKLFTFGNFQRSSAIIHQTVRCITGQCPVPQGRATLNSPASGIHSAIIYRTVSGVPAEQRLLSRQRSPATTFNARQSAQESGTREKAHWTVYMTCPVHHRTTRWAHKTELQRSADVAGAPDCPVRPSTSQEHLMQRWPDTLS